MFPSVENTDPMHLDDVLGGEAEGEAGGPHPPLLAPQRGAVGEEAEGVSPRQRQMQLPAASCGGGDLAASTAMAAVPSPRSPLGDRSAPVAAAAAAAAVAAQQSATYRAGRALYEAGLPALRARLSPKDRMRMDVCWAELGAVTGDWAGTAASLLRNLVAASSSSSLGESRIDGGAIRHIIVTRGEERGEIFQAVDFRQSGRAC